MKKIDNFYSEDKVVQEIAKEYLSAEFHQWAEKELMEFGESCANNIDERAVHTDREGQPRLIKYNRFGEEVSEVWVNEGYKKTVEETYNRGIVGYVHKNIPGLNKKGNYMYSYLQGYLLSQTEPGFYCPVTLTMATAYLLDHYADEDVKAKFLPHVISTGETELFEGATFLTERQGGSDVGANVVMAKYENGTYQLYGEKYFASNAGMCGVAMVLARIEESAPGTKGLSLFAVPWRNEDSSLNGIKIRRLKDKLGVRAVPSGEVEFEGAKAYLVGEASKGIYYMMEALNLSRVCNAIASIGIMRRAYMEAKNYAFHREAFGKRLYEYPMVKDTLVKLAVKHEVETKATFKLVHIFDQVMRKEALSTEKDMVLNRLLIAILKKESAEQAIHFCHEAIEMHGGNGYIEDFVMARLLRDAQVLTVWEGTANILGLEVLRLMQKYQAHQVFIDYIEEKLLNNASSVSTDLIKNGLEELKRMTAYISQSDEAVQTFHSKKIAKLMADLFESIIAIEYAEKSERNRKVAEVFLEMTWLQFTRIDHDMKSVQYFDEIVKGTVEKDSLSHA
ncbi:acyl-CoA dehydrogenase family protein [Bacillus salitolerans]|uniref:Acyl-CoA dehydrogenase family protein n=1 Tax=Bacillus salitolerans TaxID=1437434 RepID=A0ABW4LZU8_9BACI